jgi:hypothetical protein
MITGSSFCAEIAPLADYGCGGVNVIVNAVPVFHFPNINLKETGYGMRPG